MEANKIPLWLETVKDKRRYKPLSGTIETDVVVIGAGIAGVMAAWNLAKKGARVVLLEKNHVAMGDTGFTTAFITRVPDTSAAKLVKLYGKDFLTKVFAASTEAENFLRQTIEEENIDCDFASCAAYNCAYEAGDKVLKGEWAAVNGSDPHATLITGTEAGAAGGSNIVEAIRFDNEARFDVRKFIFGLLKRPTAKKIKIFEETQALEIIGGNPVRVKTAAGEVVAKKVIISSGQPFNKHFQHLLNPKITYAITAEFSEGAPISDNIYWDTDVPYQYYRRYDEKTVVLGGADTEIKTERADSAVQHEKLSRFLTDKFPGRDFKVTRAWSGNLFETEDGLPYFSRHPFYGQSVFVATGFGGNGMVMGTLSGMVLSDLALERENQHAGLFSFERTGAKPIMPPAGSPAPRPNPIALKATPFIKFLRWLLPIIYLILFIVPGYIFFSDRGGLSFLAGDNFQTANYAIFPLFGLYAFFLVWAQLMIGSSMSLFRRVYPNIFKFHRAEGLFAILLAATHPSLLVIGVGIQVYLAKSFIPPSLHIYVLLGQIQLFLMMLTVGTALLMRHPWLRTRWHYIHLLNYLVFISAWVHSWFLGTDVQSTPLRYLWLFFGLTALISSLRRLFELLAFLRKRNPAADEKLKKSELATPAASFTKVASVSEMSEGSPLCVQANGQKIALFKLGEKFYAIKNECSHAGGPLCEGKLSGKIIECPWHGSQFDITTGEVAGPPANSPQQTYPVKVSGDDISIAV